MTAAADWQGRIGETWAAEWRQIDRSVAELAAVLDAAILEVAPERGQALDIGCGAGATSIALAAARPRLATTGVDLSADLIEVAQARCPELANARFAVADAADAGAGWNLLVSRHGLMFFADPQQGFSRLANDAAEDVPLVFSCFAHAAENEFASTLIEEVTGDKPAGGDGPGPFALADDRRVRDLLAATGWSDIEGRRVPFSYIPGEGPTAVEDATRFLTRIGPMAARLREAAEPARADLRSRLRDALARREKGGVVALNALAWVWRARKGASR